MRWFPAIICLFTLTLITKAAADQRGFWIVEGPEQNCTIVETEPRPSQTAIKKLGKSRYDSREEAEADIDRVCGDK